MGQRVKKVGDRWVDRQMQQEVVRWTDGGMRGVKVEDGVLAFVCVSRCSLLFFLLCSTSATRRRPDDDKMR